MENQSSIHEGRWRRVGNHRRTCGGRRRQCGIRSPARGGVDAARWDSASRSQRVTAARWDPASRSRSKERRLGTDAVRDDRMREEVACRRRWRTGRRRGGRRCTRRRWGQRRISRSKGIRVEGRRPCRVAAQGGGWGDGGAALEGGRQWEAVLGWVKGRGGPGPGCA